MSPERKRAVHRVMTSVFSCLVLVAIPAPQTRTHDRDVHEILTSSATDSMKQELVACGPDAIPTLFELLVRGTYAPSDRPESSLPLGPLRERAILDALARLPSSSLSRFLNELIEEEPRRDQRETALRLVGEIGKATDVGLLERIARLDGRGTRIARSVQSSFEQALERLLERHPRALYGIVTLYPRAHPSLLHPIIRVVGRSETDEGLDVLGRLLGRIPAADSLLLWEIGRMAEALGPPYPTILRAEVRAYLRDLDSLMVLHTTQVVAQLDDLEAIPELIDLLERSEPVVVRAAADALRALTGQQLGTDSARWQRWYEDENAWWTQHGSETIRVLRDGEPAEIARILRQVVDKRLFRRRLEDPLVGVLGRSEPDLVSLAASALGRLRLESATPQLVECLRRNNRGVRASAGRALREITGADLPADHHLWRRYLALQEGA